MDKEQLLATVLETVEGLGYILVESHFHAHKNHGRLSVVIHVMGGNVSSDDCSKVASVLSRRLDVDDPIEHPYDLVVESPGSDREIKSPREYEIFSDREFALTLKDGKAYGLKDNRLIGTPDGLGEDSVWIKKPDGTKIEIKLGDIARAKLYFDIKKYL